MIQITLLIHSETSLVRLIIICAKVVNRHHKLQFISFSGSPAWELEIKLQLTTSNHSFLNEWVF